MPVATHYLTCIYCTATAFQQSTNSVFILPKKCESFITQQTAVIACVNGVSLPAFQRMKIAQKTTRC